MFDCGALNGDVFGYEIIGQNILAKFLFCRAFTNDNHSFHNGCPPFSMFCFHKSPRVYSSNQAFRLFCSSLFITETPSNWFTVIISSALKLLMRSALCVAMMTWVSFAAADFIIPDNFWIAKGCNPNSGSSMIMTLGRFGCKNNVAKAINLIVPSDRSVGP